MEMWAKFPYFVQRTAPCTTFDAPNGVNQGVSGPSCR